MINIVGALIFAVVLIPAICVAELDKASSDALDQTLKLMTNEQERTKAISKSPEAARADANAKGAVGSQQNLNQVYEISAIVMADLVKKTNGDVAALNTLMLEAGKNPEKFFNSLSPESQEKIKQLSKKVEPVRQPSSPPH